MNYQEEYQKLLETLSQDTSPWQPVETIPKDRTQVYFMCGKDYKGDTLYDVGRYEDYRLTYYYDEGLEGEFTTSFGNCDQILGWKLV